VSELALSWIMALNAPMVWRHTGYDVIPCSYVVLPYGSHYNYDHQAPGGAWHPDYHQKSLNRVGVSSV
jgi:hypothetical protein